MTTPCPICKKLVESSDDKTASSDRSNFPFCSERCKLIDLGRWLDGQYQIPVAHDDLDESTESSPDNS
jgi:endogenous inhibitor of DNA gyrase (YacG/DUF329 family)